MSAPLKYIVDNSGKRTSVLVPVRRWEKLTTDYKKLQAKLAVLNGIEEGISEVKRSQKSGKKLQTLNDFLK